MPRFSSRKVGGATFFCFSGCSVTRLGQGLACFSAVAIKHSRPLENICWKGGEWNTLRAVLSVSLSLSISLLSLKRMSDTQSMCDRNLQRCGRFILQRFTLASQADYQFFFLHHKNKNAWLFLYYCEHYCSELQILFECSQGPSSTFV